ncbi:site-specific integrase [[Clostridium] polysaccharolyticum]|uniref:Integrase n=1 Tax=[Clostridium] polysaccharolyticum TaxID=29364 RepID=A0A1H9YKN8_9FIRM|nr:site-specific integrase [[Clostridium] polysaccharolyticum]SES69530.1 Integrase [[Clostridium] polysaccharolyticum]
MAKAKKLPSGQWRTLVYSHTDGNGKRKYESFTADTKKESEYLAAEFAMNKKKSSGKKVMPTFKVAFETYIDSKSNVLSPSTIRGYVQMKSYYNELDNVLLSDINTQLLQSWVNELSKTHAPKTVSNAHGLVVSIMNFFDCKKVTVTLPAAESVTYHIPNDEEIQRIIEYLKENDMELLKAVYLAAFATLRRSEIVGLSANDLDVHNNTIHVHRVRVINKDKVFVDKNTTKTKSSDRYIQIPSFVMDEIKDCQDKVVTISADNITNRFGRMLKKLKIGHFRFHDLRHYSASIMHALGIPDQYIMARGGWSNDKVLKQVYRNVMDDYNKQFVMDTNSHFEKMQHKIQHKK